MDLLKSKRFGKKVIHSGLVVHSGGRAEVCRVGATSRATTFPFKDVCRAEVRKQVGEAAGSQDPLRPKLKAINALHERHPGLLRQASFSCYGSCKPKMEAKRMEMVRVCRARKEYGALVAVDDVDWSIRKGEVWGLIGPNGAGKTTLMKLIATLHPPTSGEISVMGHDVLTSKQKVRRHLGYMPDFFNLYAGLTLDDCVRYFGRCYGVPETILDKRVGDSLAYVGLTEKRFELITHLSRGMMQRLGIANLLVHDPELIILDEPASGLDPHSRIQLRNVLKRLSSEGKTIILSSHILTELEQLVTHVCAMNRGKVLECGELKEMRRKMASTRVHIELFPESLDAQAAAAVLDQVHGVTSIRVEGWTLHFYAEGGGRTLAECNRALVTQGFSVCGMGQKEEDLESLFLQMTGGSEQQ